MESDFKKRNFNTRKKRKRQGHSKSRVKSPNSKPNFKSENNPYHNWKFGTNRQSVEHFGERRRNRKAGDRKQAQDPTLPEEPLQSSREGEVENSDLEKSKRQEGERSKDSTLNSSTQDGKRADGSEATVAQESKKRHRTKPNMTLKALKGCSHISYEAFLRAFRRALVNEKLSWFQAHLAEALQRSSDAVALALHLFLDPNTVKPLNSKDKITIPIKKLLLQVINPTLCNGKSSIAVITPHLFIQPRHFHVVLEFLDNMAYSNDPNDHISAKHLWMLYRFFPQEYRSMFIKKIIECTQALCNNPRNSRIILAAKIVIKFQLHYHFRKEELLFPLVRFKKQLNIVFDYITSAPADILEELQVSALSKIADPKCGNDPGKAFQKLLEWGLGIARFPKIIHYRRRAALQWLIKIQRHMEFLDFISDDKDLLMYLCKELQLRKKQEDIERIVQQFHLNFHYVGPSKPFREQPELKSTLPILSMESFDIRWVVVNNLETLHLAQKAILRENVVGLDTESLPIQIFHPARAPPPVQIFQIGTRHCAYLFDLNVKHILPHFFSFLQCLFSDVRIIKVGMNFQIDLRELRQQYPVGRWNTKCFFHIRHFLELMDLKPLLSKTTPKAEPSGRRETGLEKIFRHVMGIGLDKTCQISNWARRPLTNAQISYAAIDAAVPVMIYQTLCKRGLRELQGLIKDFCFNE